MKLKTYGELQPHLESVQRTYGFHDSHFEALTKHLQQLPFDQGNIHIFEVEGHWLLAGEGDDALGQDATRQPYLLYDDMIDYNSIIRGLPSNDEVKVIAEGLPVAVVDLHKHNAEKWASGVKTQSTYIKGGKYSHLDITIEACSPQQGLADYAWAFEHKKIKYPDSRADQDFAALCDLANAQHAYAIDIKDTVLDKKVCNFLCAAAGETLYGYFILTSDDEIIIKKHRSYIVGHVEVVRLAERLNLRYANFGMFFQFKDLLNFDKHWVKGLRYNRE